MKIEILGGVRCLKCEQLKRNVEKAVKELGINAQIEKVADLKKIMNYGVMMTPGLVVNGKLKSTGLVLSVEEIKKIIRGQEGI